jgi:TonB family protein
VVPPGEEVYDVAAIEKAPELRNRRDVERVARREYPEFLRDAGISSEAIVSFVIDRDGRVEPGSIQIVNDVQPAVADAARRVAERMRFRPAEIRGERVKTRAQVPITFGAN